MSKPMDFTTPAYREWKASCQGDACQQGRKPCSTPEACRQADNDGSDFGALDGLTRTAPLSLLLWTVIACVAAVIVMVIA